MDDTKISLRVSEQDLNKIEEVKEFMLDLYGIHMSTSEVLRSCVYYRVNAIKKGKDEE